MRHPKEQPQQEPEQAPALAATMEGPPSSVPPRPFTTAPVPPDWERYEVFGLIGKGGMGAVYKARDRRLGRIVALKFIRGDGPQLTQRLLREARAQSRIEHDHVCKVYEAGEINGHAYIAMQLIDGRPLSDLYRQLSLEQNVSLMATIAEAVHAAHRIGIIHRDIKPSNILVERDEDGRLRPIVMDFGLAHDSTAADGLTQSGAVMGTPQYMSPEQARGETRRVDRRSDVYSLGAMLYELLTGCPPFGGGSVTEVLLQVLEQEPEPPRLRRKDLPVDLETIVLRCLQNEPSARYESARALAEDLRRFQDGEPVLARRISRTRRLYLKARKHKPLVALGAALLVSLLSLGAYSIRTRLEARAREHQTQQQVALAEHLGQEISRMEWLLRSARQLPLHDLGREKAIVREQMEQLQKELASYGQLSEGLAHYALGRGHMALHEYPKALVELRKATHLGLQTAEVHYALGFVLGKHFEQAIYEARLSGGGDWAKKQLKEIEPKYLTPAIASLQKSRTMRLDSPQYLEALIAYYQRNYQAALEHATAALKKAPWLYEAIKLSGDVHLERALQARDSGRYEEAEREFAEAVRSYEAAASMGQSDGEVYEGLAEAWVRQIEMALNRGQPTEVAYAAALASSDKILIVEPQSVTGLIKKAFAALMTIGLLGTGMNASNRIQDCLAAAEAALKKQPGHPYASDAASSCYGIASESVLMQGGNPEPFYRKALNLLEPTLQNYPNFLWGYNDLAVTYNQMGSYLRLHGDPEARKYLDTALEYETKALTLDPTYLTGLQASLWARSKLVEFAETEAEMQAMLTQADAVLAKCKSVNDKFQQCYDNYFIMYAKAAQLTHRAGQDPQPRLRVALDNLAQTRKAGGQLLDMEQYAALSHLVDASDRVRRKQDPELALREMRTALARCFTIAAKDAMCRTLAAQGKWVESDWQMVQNQRPVETLSRALKEAMEATQSPEIFPEAWQTVAETHLRLASAHDKTPVQRSRDIEAGLAAAEKIFAVNPNHALGNATKGELELLRAQTEPGARRAAAQAAVAAFELALKNAPLHAKAYGARLAEAKALVPASP